MCSLALPLQMTSVCVCMSIGVDISIVGQIRNGHDIEYGLLFQFHLQCEPILFQPNNMRRQSWILLIFFAILEMKKLCTITAEHDNVWMSWIRAYACTIFHKFSVELLQRTFLRNIRRNVVWNLTHSRFVRHLTLTKQQHRTIASLGYNKYYFINI